MTEQLLNAVYNEVDEIKNMDAYKKLLELNKAIKETLKDELLEFRNANDEFQKAKEFGEYYPNYKEIANRLSIAKKVLYQNELVIEYKKCEEIINDYLLNLNKELINASRGE